MAKEEKTEAEKFVERHRHELAGLICDAALVARGGAPLAIFLRESMKLIDARLKLMYAELRPEPKPEAKPRPDLTPRPTSNLKAVTQ